MQTLASWASFNGISEQDVTFGGKNFELYFEAEDMTAFAETLKAMENIKHLHPLKEMPWGQLTVRFYDPDKNVIEVGESLHDEVNRFVQSGFSQDEIAKRMDVPFSFVKRYLK